MSDTTAGPWDGHFDDSIEYGNLTPLKARVQELEEALEAIYEDGLKHEAIDCGDHCHHTCVWCKVRAALRK